jgi:hypothetical protein
MTINSMLKTNVVNMKGVSNGDRDQREVDFQQADCDTGAPVATVHHGIEQEEAHAFASAAPSYVAHAHVAVQPEWPGTPYASAQSPV